MKMVEYVEENTRPQCLTSSTGTSVGDTLIDTFQNDLDLFPEA